MAHPHVSLLRAKIVAKDHLRSPYDTTYDQEATPTEMTRYASMDSALYDAMFTFNLVYDFQGNRGM